MFLNYGDEEKQVVQGLHKSIVSEEVFNKVQFVLAQVLEKHASRVEKNHYNRELPLRGFLQCPNCASTWTGSGSKGNGGVYHYYHCQNGCPVRTRAADANELFIDYLIRLTQRLSSYIL